MLEPRPSAPTTSFARIVFLLALWALDLDAGGTPVRAGQSDGGAAADQLDSGRLRS